MLLAEHEANIRFKPFDRPQGPANVSDAYDIQQHYVGLLRAGHGESIGYKVGLTSKQMQAFCGIDHPIAGVVLARRELRSGATIRRADFGRLGLEFEIAVRIKSNVPATASPMTAEAIAPYIGGVCAAIELVDDRAADYTQLDVLALLADNSWNGGIVISDGSRHGRTWQAFWARRHVTAPRSAKAMAATSSAIPSIRWRGWPPTSPPEAKACRPVRS